MQPKRVLVCADHCCATAVAEAVRRAFPQAEHIHVRPERVPEQARDGDLVILTDGTLAALPAPRSRWGVWAGVLSSASASGRGLDAWVRMVDGWEEELRERIAAVRVRGVGDTAAGQPGAVAVDCAGRLRWANDAARALAARLFGAWQVRSIWELVPPRGHPQVHRLMREIFHDGRPVAVRTVAIPDVSGQLRVLAVEARPRHNAAGRVALAVCRCWETMGDDEGCSSGAVWAEEYLRGLLRVGVADSGAGEVVACDEACRLFGAEAAAVGVEADGANAALAMAGSTDAEEVVAEVMASGRLGGEDQLRPPATRAGTWTDAEAVRWHWMAAGVELSGDRVMWLTVAARRAAPWTDGQREMMGLWAAAVLRQISARLVADELRAFEDVVRAVWGAAASGRHRLILTAAAQALGRASGVVGAWALVPEGGELIGPFPPQAAARLPSLEAKAAAMAEELAADGEGVMLSCVDRFQVSEQPCLVGAAVPMGDEAAGALVVAFSSRAAAELWRGLVELAAEACRGSLRGAPAAGEEAFEPHYKALFEASGAAAMVVDGSGWIRLVNRRFEELTGYSREEVVGRMKALMLAAPHEWARLATIRHDRLAGKRSAPRSYEADYVTKSGERRRASVWVGVVDNSRDEVVTFVDITGERQLRRQLLQAEKSAALGQLVAGVAHEINNPLGAILGSAELAAMATDDPKVRRNLERIVEETERCRRIVANLLSFARERRYERMPVDVNMLIHQVVEMEAYQMTVDNIKVRLLLDPDLPPVQADPASLQQVFLNIVVNAHQAMKGTGGGELTIESDRRGKKALLTFKDTGPGIRTEHIDRIFDPFFTTKPPGQGTGLGLSVSLGIVQELGGRIWAESTPGQGATFYVELPLAEAKKPVRRRRRLDDEGPVAPTCTRVLVVDDEPAVRDVLESALEAAGYLVQGARDGDEALIMMRTGDFHVVVCDLRLPRIDGTRLYEMMVEEKPDLAKRFVLITGDTVSQETRAFLEATGCRSLSKPFRLSQLREVVAEVASRAHQREGGRARRRSR